MPLVYQQNINDHTKIGVWHISEPENFFLKEIEINQAISHPQKRLQYLAGRYLLKEIENGFPIIEIEISFSKKPYVKGGQFHFSISHSGNYVAAIISKKNIVGIDIELPQSKINNIKHKFISDSEALLLSTISMQDEYRNTLAWSIKEAVFKWYGEGQVDFIKHINIQSVEAVENYFRADIVFKKSTDILLKANAIFFEGYYLVWVI